MMKLLAVVLLIAVAQASLVSRSLVKQRNVEDNNCPYTETCVAAGAACGLSGSTISLCGNGYYCGSSSTCVQQVAAGGSCDITSEDQCVSTAICVGTLSSAVCTTVTFTAGLGADCNATNECNSATLACRGTCVTTQTTGQSCSLTSPCFGSEYCASGTCVAPFSVAVGSSCEAAENCVVGSFCYFNGQGAGECIAGFTSSKKTCNSDDDCNTYEECTCSSPKANSTSTCIAPSTYTSSEASDELAFETCMKNNNCPLFTEVSGLCSACKSAYCKVYKETAVESSLQCLNDQATISLCGHASSSASMVVASCLVFVVALFAL